MLHCFIFQPDTFMIHLKMSTLQNTKIQKQNFAVILDQVQKIANLGLQNVACMIMPTNFVFSDFGRQHKSCVESVCFIDF